MENQSPIEIAFSQFDSKESALEQIVSTINTMKKANKRPCINQVCSDLIKFSAVAGDNKEVTTALSEASNLINDAFFGPKLNHCDPIFFPSRENEKKLIEYLKMADQYCYVALYTITNDYLARVLYTLYDRGVDVRIVTDDETAFNNGSDITALANAGICVRVDPDKDARMHHKFVILDDELLINGSFNFTTTAVLKNNENMIAIDHPDLIKSFKAEFTKIWDACASGEIKGNGVVEKYLIEYKNKYKGKHPKRWQ